MLHGTGIAEVALPMEERIRTVRETEEMAAAAATGGRGVFADGGWGGRSGHGGGGTAAGRKKAGVNIDIKAMMLPTSFGKVKRYLHSP